MLYSEILPSILACSGASCAPIIQTRHLMSFCIAIALLAGIVPAPLNPLDGQWTLVRLEIGGRAMDVGHPSLEIRQGRLIVQSPQIVLQLDADHRVRRWPPSAPRTYCPYTPKEWARRFGDPIFWPGPEQ